LLILNKTKTSLLPLIFNLDRAMKTFLKLFLPTLIPYLIFARYTALDEAHKQITYQLTEISLTSLMFYFRYTSPYLYIVLFLTQYVVVLSIWDSLNNRLLRAVLFTLLWVLLASLLLAIGVSYIIWDKALGSKISILFIIDLIAQKTKKEEKEE
jgi:hypothetical protein